jgi:hypothetical protein
VFRGVEVIEGDGVLWRVWRGGIAGESEIKSAFVHP